MTRFDYIEIGPVPFGEDCAQMGEENFERLSAIECRAYMNQLLRIWPDGDFAVKRFNHDFGTYSEVVAWMHGADDIQTNIAYEAEASGPEFWDEEAKLELTERKAQQ
jgi:hypothetical protein